MRIIYLFLTLFISCLSQSAAQIDHHEEAVNGLFIETETIPVVKRLSPNQWESVVLPIVKRRFKYPSYYDSLIERLRLYEVNDWEVNEWIEQEMNSSFLV